MLLTLKITAEAPDFDIGATPSTGLRNFNHLLFPGSAISPHAMSGIVEHCESLKTIVLYRQERLAATDVHIDETLPSLRRSITSDDVAIDGDFHWQICRICPGV